MTDVAEPMGSSDPASADDGGPAPLSAIPFNRPSLQGREIELMRLAVEHGHTSADGPFSAKVAEVLRDEIGAADVLLTTSCTAALEMAALLLDLGPDDTVVVPSFGFVTTALAFVRPGARVLFCDIEERTLGLDPGHLADLMDDSVRAVVPIHYAGVPCDVDGILGVLDAWPRAELVEDNAHGLFGRHRGRPLGSFGRFSTLSFHETKNFICGEGGALVVNRGVDVDRAHVVYHKGTNRRAFLHGQVDKYSWQDTGSSFGLSDVLAAFLHGQLEQREAILAKRRRVFDRYRQLLAPAAPDLGLRLPHVPDDCEQAYHMFHVVLPDAAARNRALAALGERGVHATFHFVPLHSSPAGQRFAARPTACPVTDDLSARLLRLPFFTDLEDDEIDRVVETLLDVLDGS
jgi:dTDP-4-amino-4,6-dideoxygalactose transaminase